MTRPKHVKLPKQDKALGVGKRMGKTLYLHRSALSAVPAVAERIKAAGITTFNVVKINEATGAVSLITSSDFDTAHEPTVDSSILLRADGTFRKVSLPQDDPWIYHHKWLFVSAQYTGFDVEASKARSLSWLSLENVDSSRIGRRSFWRATLQQHGMTV